jgi:hypothetical protein
MEVWREDTQVGLGEAVRVDLAGGSTHFQGPEALDIGYARAIREFCQKEGLDLPGSFHEYEDLAARATLTRLAEEHQTLDLLATREALRELPDPGYGYQYTEGYDPHSGCYVCERSAYVGQDRYADTLSISLEDGAAYVESTWGSMSYWDRFVYPPEGEPYYAGTVNDDFRGPPGWAVEKSPQAEVTWEPER